VGEHKIFLTGGTAIMIIDFLIPRGNTARQRTRLFDSGGGGQAATLIDCDPKPGYPLRKVGLPAVD
jgi:hypothetical protein